MQNPYVRALLANLILFGAAALRLLQQIGTKWTPRHTVASYTLGIVCLVSAAVVGTLARRSAQRWSWIKTIMASIACGIGTMILILVFQKVV
jgi:hypothetical protein